jgi:hypothetical protein
MIRSSRYLHVVDLGGGSALLIHALSQVRLTVDAQVAGFVRWFETPRKMPEQLADLPGRDGLEDDILARCLATLMEHGVLTDLEPEAEAAAASTRLGDLHGRDPKEALDRWRLGAKVGAEPQWAVAGARSTKDLGWRAKHRIDVLLFGDCDLQMEADFLKSAAQPLLSRLIYGRRRPFRMIHASPKNEHMTLSSSGLYALEERCSTAAKRQSVPMWRRPPR